MEVEFFSEHQETNEEDKEALSEIVIQKWEAPQNWAKFDFSKEQNDTKEAIVNSQNDALEIVYVENVAQAAHEYH